MGPLLAARRGGDAGPRWRSATTSWSCSTSTRGEEKARVAVPSPSQGFLFPAPGFGRDVYYQSLTTIARVAVV